MRWHRLTIDEKAAADRVQRKIWRRIFAFTPCHDPSSNMVYWLEWVWVRYIPHHMYPDIRHYDKKEYRGGRHAPELKLPSVPPTPATGIPHE